MNSEKVNPVKNTVEQLIADRSHLRPAFLETAKTDQLIDALLRLSMEIAVIRDRMDIYDHFFNQLGIDADAIENFVAGSDLEQSRSERRQLLVRQIIKDLI